MRREWLQLEFDAGEERQRPLGADQDIRRVERSGRDRIEIVAADAAQDFRKAGRDFGALARGDGAQAFDQRAIHRRLGPFAGAGLGEACARAVGQDRVDARHVVHHVAVPDGTRA